MSEVIQETEERDLIDLLIDNLNDGVNDITFDRDVLDTNRPEDWAAVELTGQDGSEWADGKLIDQVLTVDIWVSVSERGTRVRDEVQTVLQAFAEDHEIGWRLVSRNWLYDLEKVMWRWSVTMWGPIELPAAEEDDPEEPNDLDDLPFTDPEEDPEEDDPDWPDADPEDGDD